MKVSVIWIDRGQAKLFFLSHEKMERKNLQSRQIEHHTHAQDASDRERKEHRLFIDVVKELDGTDQILILGPGIAKHHFQNYLMEHQPAIARKIAGVETVDHPTDGEIAAMTKKLFEKASA